MPISPSYAGLILAAGTSSRMGTDKALLPWRNGTFLSAAIESLVATTDLVIVIAGRNQQAIAPVVYSTSAFLAVNPNPDEGQFSSLRAGLNEVLGRGRDTAIITLVDRPSPAVATIERLKQVFLAAPDNIWAVVPEFDGRHGHPFIAGREMIEAFLRAPATSNAREVEHALQGHILYYPVDDPLVAVNVNTQEEFQQLLSGQTLLGQLPSGHKA
jgi:molybdenum cofactor cytidylyltransferase